MVLRDLASTRYTCNDIRGAFCRAHGVGILQAPGELSSLAIRIRVRRWYVLHNCASYTYVRTSTAAPSLAAPAPHATMQASNDYSGAGGMAPGGS